MQSAPDLRRLDAKDWERLQEFVDQFESVCSSGDTVDLARFLPPPGDSLRSTVLDELVRTDMEIRWRRGQASALEQYVENFPELGSLSALPPQLIYEEFRVRHLHGDKPSLDSYRLRFPQQYLGLQTLLAQQPVPVLKTSIPTTPTAPVMSATTTASNEILAVGGGYKLIEQIGSGGSGEIWRAEGPAGFEVAVKIIFRPIDHKEARRELQALELIKGLRHPFLLQIQAYWQLADRLLIVMELADGSLHDRLRECRAAGYPGIPITELIAHFREAAEALDYLHGEKVLHRDIKPDNILLLKRHAKVADFGLASLQQSRRSVLANGSGTPAYMAPEVFWRGKASERSDQYSLAVTYAELRLQRPLFASRDLIEVMRRHLQMTPDLAPLCDLEQSVLLRALSKDPGQRYTSCGEFVQALEQALVSEPEWTNPQATTVVQPAGGTNALGAGSSSVPSSASTEVGWLPLHTPLLPLKATLFLVWFFTVLIALILFTLMDIAQSDSPSSSGVVEAPAANQSELPRSGLEGVPAECVAAEGAEEVVLQGKHFFTRLSYVLPEATAIDFVLIPKRHDSDPDTYYMMENKVWIGLFRRFAAAKPAFITDAAWENGPVINGEQRGYANDRLPALGVTITDADSFARWLGGRLPTVAQWDRAAGLHEEKLGLGPFRDPWYQESKNEIAVNRPSDGPLPVGTATRDVSPYHCHDMAGDGWEWTRDLLDPRNERKVPVKGTALDEVILRGQSYAANEPLYFQDLKEKPRTQPYLQPSPFIGFRIVLEPKMHP